MSAQLTFGDFRPEDRNHELGARLWVENNPEAWRYVKSQALAAKDHGHKFSMRALLEHVRWYFAVQRVNADGTTTTYKVNNNQIPHLARILVEQRPDLEPYIEFRERRVAS
jgi:hypothetical protein